MISLEGRSSQKWTKVNIFVFFHQVFSLTEMYFTELEHVFILEELHI